MINSANKYQIAALFSPEEKIKYVVPKYQREYVWGKENWEDLFNDLSENGFGHFIGSIICIDQGKDALDIKPMEIVDGQQRLTTISLLYLATYEMLLKEPNPDDDFITARTNLKHRIMLKGKKDELKLELSYQHYNHLDYRFLLSEVNLVRVDEKPPYFGNRRIYKAYKFFKDKLKNLDSKTIIEFVDKLNSAWLVKIEVDSHADAFVLFESLNDRGEPLSAIDLIKNKFLSQIEKTEEKSVDDAFDDWTSLIKSLDNYKIQERFLRHYYNAFRFKEEIKLKKYAKASKSNLIPIYEELIKQDVNLIFEELITKAKIYSELNYPNPNSGFYDELTDLLNLGSAPSFTFLLYLFCKQSQNANLNRQVIQLLINYSVRRNLTDYPNTRDLDTMFINLIDLCEAKNGIEYSQIKDYLTQPSRFSDDVTFDKRLRGDIYEENAPIARFILSKIEEQHQTKESYRRLWEKDSKGNYLWTLEHILPMGENIPNAWVDMIANGDRLKAKELQMKSVHKIGNLTLTCYNSNMSNYSFIKKKDLTDKKGNFIGYRNGLYLNKELVQKNSWTPVDIENRTNNLVLEAKKLFCIK
jgi:uncharacterized protein with ParB-like and HNH nuclease domain